MKTLSIVLTGVSLLLFIGSAASFFLNRKSRPISRRLLLLTGGFILVILLLELARRVDADGVLFPSSILVNTLQVFSLDFDYDDLFKQNGGTLSALQAFLLWYRGIVYSLAPIVGGAVILDVLAGISPDLQMFFSRRKKLYVFSELNELSVTLAEDVYRNRDNLGKLSGTGIRGAAVVSGIFAAADIEAECTLLRALAEAIVR